MIAGPPPPRLRAAALAALLAAAACAGPEVGGEVVPPPPPTGYQLVITEVAVFASRKPLVTFTLTRDGQPVALADVAALRPAFTLAGLVTDPVSGLDSWWSYLLTGRQVAQSLPLGGPGTPPEHVLASVRQPGSDAGGTLEELGPGRFLYAFGAAAPLGYDPSRTMRVGAWLGGVTPGTARTSTTFDLVPDGGPLARLETTLDERCATCHGGPVTAHGGARAGVRLCLTCHTLLNADPDTADPAALVRALTVTPEARTVAAGSAATSLTATLLASSATISWALSPASGAGSLSSPTAATSSTGGASTVRYTPPPADAAAGGPLQVTVLASAAGLTAPVALTVVQPPAAPAVLVNPAAQTLLAGAVSAPFTATLLGASGAVAWTLSPASGAGTLSAASGAAVSYTPPASVAGPTTVTLTATAGGQVGQATLTLLPVAPGSTGPATDPNPLDLGRLVHRIHRGKNLPTLYLASSTAPAPPLPLTAAPPLPFFPGRNAPAPGARYAVVGFRGEALVPGQVATRASNGQPARTAAEGIGFPRDLRDCDACHLGAPQGAMVATTISRRTCQGCHPEAWFGAGPITDLVHFAHPGGPQADDTRCAGCHVAGPGGAAPLVPIAEAHRHPLHAPRFDEPVLEVVGVSGLSAGSRPTVRFTVRDRVGPLTPLGSPQPAREAGPDASPLPRALTRVSILLAGPTTDYLSGNAPLSESVPLTLAADPVDGAFSHTFAAPLPASAAGTWSVGLEARRAGVVPIFDLAAGAYAWPYTGESLVEFADNPVVAVDTAFGSWPGGAPAPRRQVVDRRLCQACHVELSLHGSLRHNPDYCVMCHTPDGTDWRGRPKDPAGNVNLATVYPDGRVGTLDGREETSIHFKVMVHRLHTGRGQGTAELSTLRPHVIYSGGGTPFAFDDFGFPDRLADCTRCHPGASWTLGAIPPDASPTIANETASVQHAATAAHAAGERRWPPVTASCNSCHGGAFAAAHAASYLVDGVEQCAQCHLRGALGVAAAHGLAEPAP